jgi:hypothetical protein
MAAQQQQPTTPQQPGASPPKLPSHVPDMENLDPGPDPMRASTRMLLSFISLWQTSKAK